MRPIARFASLAAACALTLASLVALTSAARAGDDAAAGFSAAARGLQGAWSGALEYRDYQSGDLERIPHAQTIETAPDGSWLLARLEFTDPGFQVYALNAVTFAEDAVVSAYVRDGAVERMEEQVAAYAASADGWSAELTSSGQDGGAPADIRQIWTLSGDTLTVEKQVRPLGEDAFAFRNRVVLNRVTAD